MDKKTQTVLTYNQSAQQLADKFDHLGARVADIEELGPQFRVLKSEVGELKGQMWLEVLLQKPESLLVHEVQSLH